MQVDDVPSGLGMTVRGQIDASPNKLSAVFNTHNEEVIVSCKGEVAVRFIISDVMRDVKSIQFKGALSELPIKTQICDNLGLSINSMQRPDFWMEIDIGPFVRHRYCEPSESNGSNGKDTSYWNGTGAKQDLYDSLQAYVPWSGYPKPQMYDAELGSAIILVYIMGRLQHEWFNNAFMNVGYDEVATTMTRECMVLKSYEVEHMVSYSYSGMLKYLADTYKIQSAQNIIDAYEHQIMKESEFEELQLPSDVEYDSDDEYDIDSESEYDEMNTEAQNESAYRTRHAARAKEFRESMLQSMNKLHAQFENTLHANIVLLGEEVMNKVITLMNQTLLDALLKHTKPDSTTQARFNRSGFCFKPGE